MFRKKSRALYTPLDEDVRSIPIIPEPEPEEETTTPCCPKNCCTPCTCEISKQCCSSLLSMATFLTICGFLFDMFQVSLSIADVVTDIMVAVEFRQNGHTAFFALVVTTLTITSIVNGCIFLLRLGITVSPTFHEIKVASLFLIFSAFGLLWPSINYICTKTGFGLKEDSWTYDKPVAWEKIGEDVKKNMTTKETEASENNDENSQSQQSQSPLTASLNLFLNKVAPEHAALGMLDNAVVERVMSYLIMNSQTLSESVPQLVIQVIAISIFGEVTTLQVISLTLSMFSVVCKAFQLTRSFCTKAFFAKIFYLAHDLFSMVFVFSVLLATNAPRTSNFFFLSDELSPFKINPVCNVWLMIKLINIVIWSILGIWLWIFFVTSEVSSGNRSRFIKGSILGFFGGAVVIGPLLFVQECVKTSWIIAFNFSQSPSTSNFPLVAILHQFLHGGSSSSSSSPVMYPTTDWTESYAALARKLRVVCDDRAKKFDLQKFTEMKKQFFSGNYLSQLPTSLPDVRLPRLTHRVAIPGRSPKASTTAEAAAAATAAATTPRRTDDADNKNENENNQNNEKIEAVDEKTSSSVIAEKEALDKFLEEDARYRAALAQTRKMEKEKFLRELTAAEYRSPFLNITVTGGYGGVNSDAFMQVCQKPFTLESVLRNKNPDLSDNYFDFEREAMIARQEAKEKEIIADDKTERLMSIQEDSAQSTSTLIKIQEDNNNNNNERSPLLFHEEKNRQEDLTKKFRKVPDNFVSRARHCTIAADFYKKIALAAQPPTSYTFKVPLNNPRNFDGFTAGVAPLLDPYGDFSASTFILENPSPGRFFSNLWELLAKYNICVEPRMLMTFITVITFIISALTGLVFPIVYAALYFSSFSIMQKICFYSAMASLLFGLLLSTSFYKYQLTCMFFKLRLSEAYDLRLSAEKLFQIIDNYFSLPLSTLTVANIREKNKKKLPTTTKNKNANHEEEQNENTGESDSGVSAAIPEDCFFEHVLPFLTTKHCYLYGVPDDKFAKMQESVLRYTAPGLFEEK